VPDIRNSRVIDILRELDRYGIRTQLHDPWAPPNETKHEYDITLITQEALQPADAVILAVAHRDYVKEGWPLMVRLLKGGKGTVIDVKTKLDRDRKPEGIDLWRL
jgi:UDP-N-acetyl-D-galactosamine dehydrogenase